MTAFDRGWVVAFLEGEGCFTLSRNGKRWMAASITAAQKQRWPLQRLHKFFGGSLTFYAHRYHGESIWQWRLSSQQALALMRLVLPYMSPKRKREIRRALSCPLLNSPAGSKTHRARASKAQVLAWKNPAFRESRVAGMAAYWNRTRKSRGTMEDIGLVV